MVCSWDERRVAQQCTLAYMHAWVGGFVHVFGRGGASKSLQRWNSRAVPGWINGRGDGGDGGGGGGVCVNCARVLSVRGKLLRRHVHITTKNQQNGTLRRTPR